MNKALLAALTSIALLGAANSHADAYSLPVSLDYRLIKNVVTSQLYKGPNNTAEVWNDKKGCSFLKLSDLQVSGQQAQIKLVNHLEAQFGTRFGGQCVKLLEWNGLLETLQKPTVSADQSVLSLPVTQITATDNAGRVLTNDKLQALIKRVAEPQLAAVKIDLNASRADMEKSVSRFLPKENEADVKAILATLKFEEASANDQGVTIKLGFAASPKAADPKPGLPLSAAEQQQWQASWQQWEAFMTKAINKASADSKSPELSKTLKTILQDSRAAAKQGLSAPSGQGEDPVRTFFLQTWQRLAPELKTLASQMPELQALRYLTFISATDVLYELESRGAPLGLVISSDGLKRLARLLIAGQQEQAK